ncbi:MAG: ABC transporter permease, partial [Acidobacteriota bacterium]
MEPILQDLRYGLRTLIKNPMFTAVAVFCLALSIGANTAIFSVVNGVLLSPLPFESPDELVRIYTVRKKTDGSRDQFSLSPQTYVELRDGSESFAQLALIRDRTLSLSSAGDPVRLEAVGTTFNLFELLGIQPIRGRAIQAEEDRPGGPNVAVLSYSLWQRQFAGDERIVGQTAIFDDIRYTVIGIMPEGFSYPSRTEVWVPLGLDPQQMPDRQRHNLSGIARLAPGIDLSSGQTEMDVVAARLAQTDPETYESLGLFLLPVRDRLIGDGDQALILLLIAVGFVLLIACSAVASLILARGSTTSQAVAVRASLGASRGRLIVQFLVESLLLALLGSAVGLLLANFAMPLLATLVPPDVRPHQDYSIDLRVLAFTGVMVLLTSLGFGLVPAMRFSSVPPQILLRGGRGATGKVRGQRLQSALVVLELAIAVVLLIATGLLSRSFRNLIDIDPGFSTERVLVLRLDPPAARYAEPEQQTAFLNDILERLAALPGARAIGSTTTLPMGDGHRNRAARFSVEGQIPENPGDFNVEFYRMISPGYFDAMSMPMLEGRAFSDLDQAETQGVAIVSEAMAERYWPGERAVGKRLKRGTYTSE